MLELYNGKSVYRRQFNDESSITLNPINIDATEYIQKAINEVAMTKKNGIIFLLEGEYIISDTLLIYAGIRLIGCGERRPVIRLKDSIYAKEKKYMIHFRSGLLKNNESRDANPGTFYSGLSNIDLNAGSGNVKCEMIRSFFAQHCFIENVDFFINDALSGIAQVGNVIDNCRFFNGRYGIDTGKPSPSWPFLMTNCYFENQNEAAIHTFECGLTMLNVIISNTKVAIKMAPNHIEKLYAKNCRVSNVDILLQMNITENPRMYAIFENVQVDRVPIILQSRDQIIYQSLFDLGIIDKLIYGTKVLDGFNHATKHLEVKERPVNKLEEIKSFIPAFPNILINVKEHGVKGDGISDDTMVIQGLINKYECLYFPCGYYLITDSLILNKKTRLYGLNPITTQIGINDGCLAFGEYSLKGMIICPHNNEYNVISGIGLDTGGNNPQACALDYQVGNGYLNDIKIIGGHGTFDVNGNRVPLYNENRSADPNQNRKWDSQYPSIIIRNNGGGFFKNIWSASTFAKAGILVEDTNSDVVFAGISLEHHINNELIIKRSSNVCFYDIQFEVEHQCGRNSLPLLIEDSHNLTFANLYLYRVIWNETPFHHGIEISNSSQIDFYGLHNYAACKYAFDNTVYLTDNKLAIREREIAHLSVDDKLLSQNCQLNDKVTILKQGYEFIQSLINENDKILYFLEERKQIIYRYEIMTNKINSRYLNNISARSITIDTNGELHIINKFGACFCLGQFFTDSCFQIPLSSSQGDYHFIFPRNLWRDGHDFLEVVVADNKNGYLCNDNKTMIVNFTDLHRCYGLRLGTDKFIMSDEFSQRVYELDVVGSNLTNPILIAELGEFDALYDGDYYILEGDLYIKNNQTIKRVCLPSRPSSIIKIDNILYITTRSELLKVEIDN